MSENTEDKTICNVNHARTLFLEKKKTVVAAHIKYFMTQITEHINNSSEPIKYFTFSEIIITEEIKESLDILQSPDRGFTVKINKSVNQCDDYELNDITFSGWATPKIETSSSCHSSTQKKN
jgi:hypothetical protein